MVIEMANLRVSCAEAVQRAVELQNLIAEAAQTTTCLLRAAPDVMAKMFDDAAVVGLWLSTASSSWSTDDVWRKYETRDGKVSETKDVQPLFSTGGVLFGSFPAASAWSLRDTSKSHELGLTHDVTLYQKSFEHSALGIGAIIELTGQKEGVESYPSKDHKAKFVRDLLRVHMERGNDTPVHGCVTDLSRIVCVKLVGFEDHKPVLHRTTVMTGAAVKSTMEAFACASTVDLGVTVQSYKLVVEADQNANIKVVPSRQLGHGGNGRVFVVATGKGTGEDVEGQYLKVAHLAADAVAEIETLRALGKMALKGVPTLLAAGDKCLLASPVGRLIVRDQLAVLSFGAQVCRTLQAVHGAGLVHRDVRPQNIIVITADALKISAKRAMLIDWASAVGSKKGLLHPYQGTYNFAAIGVLDALAAEGVTEVVATSAFDLESLVYTVAWLSDKRIPIEMTAATVRLGSDQKSLRCSAIKGVWEVATARSIKLRERVAFARACNYDELSDSWTVL
jgi:hypothetical protein